MLEDEIRNALFAARDEAYAAFQKKLIPDTALPVIGVRTPALRAYAKTLARRADVDTFLDSLPHAYFDENQLHAFVISCTRDFSAVLEQVNAFLPYVDCWATCDQLTPKSLGRDLPALLTAADGWLASAHPYTVRFGIEMLMTHFLGDRFDPAYAERVLRVESDHYYVNMMRAWYFATALAKNPEETLPILEARRLDDWTHKKTVRKAIESFRIPQETKAYLRTLL